MSFPSESISALSICTEMLSEEWGQRIANRDELRPRLTTWHLYDLSSYSIFSYVEPGYRLGLTDTDLVLLLRWWENGKRGPLHSPNVLISILSYIVLYSIFHVISTFSLRQLQFGKNQSRSFSLTVNAQRRKEVSTTCRFVLLECFTDSTYVWQLLGVEQNKNPNKMKVLAKRTKWGAISYVYSYRYHTLPPRNGSNNCRVNGINDLYVSNIFTYKLSTI
jgi:hypothetical protein